MKEKYKKRHHQFSEKENLKQKVMKKVDIVKCEGTDALWQTAALKVLQSATVPAKAALAKVAPKPIVDLLDSKYGEAGLAYVLGVALSASPLGTSAKGSRLAYELRIHGMTILTSKIVDVVFVPIKGTITEALAVMPDL